MTTSVLGQKRWSCPLRPFTRDELANDRSFLAWLRTGKSLFRLGFVVDKVALLVQPDAGNRFHGTLQFEQGESRRHEFEHDWPVFHLAAQPRDGRGENAAVVEHHAVAERG